MVRARSAVGRGIRYKLGEGGFRPLDALPTRTGLCDCSGFAAWVLGIDRWQGRHRKPWSSRIPWIETTAIVRDATGPQLLFVQLPEPVPGCLVVYGDRLGRQGHVGIVDNVRSATDFDVVDCASRRGDAIQRRDASLFLRRRAIYVTLGQDVLRPNDEGGSA